MTFAICPYCGTEKHGAFSPCNACKTILTSPEDFGLALWLTDHLHPHETLLAVGAAIKRGEVVSLPEQWREMMLRQGADAAAKLKALPKRAPFPKSEASE